MRSARVRFPGTRTLPALLFVLFAAAPAGADQPLMVVTDSPYEVFRGDRTKVQVVVYSKGFRPVAGAEILVGKTPVGVTDADGTLVFSHRPRGSFMLRAAAVVDGQAASGAVRMEAYRRTSSFESANLFVHTDRGVYRPGEEVLVRALAWQLRGEFRPLAAAAVEVGLHGPDGRPLNGDSMETDGFGVAATRLRVPEDAPEGSYTLTVRYRGAEETARLRVERFRAPAISIRHNLPRFIAPKTPDLKVEVGLAYFSGGAPADGSFEASVDWSGKQLFATRLPITKGKPITFLLPLAAIRAAVPDRTRFTVVLKATDNFGRSDEVKRDILHALQPYLAVADLDKDVYSAGEGVNLSVRLVDPDGVPVRGKPLQMEADGGRIKRQASTDDGGVALFRFVMPDHAVQVVVRSPDVPTALIDRQVPFLAEKPMRAELPRPVVKERQLTPIEITFEEGFVPTERVVHLDVVDYSGAIVGAHKIPIRRKKGRFVARGQFRAPAWGSMLATLYTAGKSPEDKKKRSRPATVGLLTEGLSLTAHPDKVLQIKLDGVPDQARPRSEVKARFSVRTAGGKMADALLGVMVVDRAVLSLLDPLEKTPMDRFYNPTLKVLSTTGSDILTWPVVSRNWGDEQYDIALPPFGFREGAPMRRVRARRSAALGGMMGDMAKPMAMKADMEDNDFAAPMAEAAKAPAKSAKVAGKVQVMKNKLALRRDGSRPPAADAAPQPRIVVRTDLPATAVWEPRLRAARGQASLSFRLPEALTEQELIVLASDKRGGLGLIRKPFKVTQPVFVRSDLPPTMVAGDRIEAGVLVQNTTTAAIEASVTLTGADAGLVVEPARRQVKVPAESAVAVRFTISAARPGTVLYRVAAIAGEQSDAEERSLLVRPRGPGRLEARDAVLKRGAPFEALIDVAADETLEAHLEIGFPTVVPALQQVEEVLSGSVAWADSHLATPLAACQLERYLARHLPDHPVRKKLRRYLLGVAEWLPRSLNPDGGTFWWRTGAGSSVPATAWALKVMAALRDADLPVPDQAIRRAVGYLEAQRQADGLWSIEATAFWEGATEKVRWQLAAQVFRALAEAVRVERFAPAERAWIEELSGRFARYLDDGLDDPLTAAEAAHGLWALELARNKGKIGPLVRKRLLRVAARLADLRREAHWEPSWFHAYGGAIEATVTSLELMARLDRRRFESAIRSGLLYLLSTRGEWGQWHCPFGTAEALRAFTFLPPPRREVPSLVSVHLGQSEIARVKIDPRDPYLSAIRLRHVAFGSLLKQGQNRLTVRYDGRLEAPLRLLLRRWSDERPSSVADGWDGGPSLARTVERTVIGLGEPLDVILAVGASSPGDSLALTSPLPANARLEQASLDALRRSPGVIKAEAGEGLLTVLLAGGEPRRLRFRLEGVRSGQAGWAAASLRSTTRPAGRVSGASGELVVR